MSKLYSLEFAVKSPSELRAMERLEALGIAKAKQAKLSDLDRQAGLFIIRVDAEESELTDEVYKKLLADKDIFILSDELSAKRAQKIITLTATVEQQLKKLLIYVLPETEKVFNDIANAHQKHGAEFKPTTRIEWCQKINNFSFGELPLVLETDISALVKAQLLSSEGLVSLITSAQDFEALKATMLELSKPKTVWSSIHTILETPTEYAHISAALKSLCEARNDAAHLNTITQKRLAETEKHHKHVMSYIGAVKSSYRENLQASMKRLAEAIKPVFESAVKIDPAIFTGYQKMMTETLKPLTDTVSKLQLDIVSPGFAEAVKKNADYQIQISKSLTSVFNNMKPLAGFQETIRQMSESGFLGHMQTTLSEVGKLRFDLMMGTIPGEDATKPDEDDDSNDDRKRKDDEDEDERKEEKEETE